MTEKAKKSTPAQPELKYVKSPEFRSTYANNVAYVVSSLDFSLIFGQVLEGDANRIVIEQITRVTMTPLQAKLLAELLTQQVADYQKRHGEIVIPEGMSSTRHVPSAD